MKKKMRIDEEHRKIVIERKPFETLIGIFDKGATVPVKFDDDGVKIQLEIEDAVALEGKYLMEVEYVSVRDDKERYTEDEYELLMDNYVKIKAIKTGDWGKLKFKPYQRALIDKYQRTKDVVKKMYKKVEGIENNFEKCVRS